MLERRMRRRWGDRGRRLDPDRLATWWRVWGRRKEAIAPMMTGALLWQEEVWEAGLQAWAERPRRRTRQQLPPEAIARLSRWDEDQQAASPIAA
jgi:hypothetical protein